MLRRSIAVLALVVSAGWFLYPTAPEAQSSGPLVPVADATHTAVQSGPWSAVATWGAYVPDADAKVVIPSGITVTVDQALNAPLFWVRVDGTLRFAPDVPTRLVADTVFCLSGGRFEMGTSSAPITSTATMTIQARNNQPIDHQWDWAELSRGVVADHGCTVEMQGQAKTAWVTVPSAPAAGATVITVSSAPSGWQVGDKVVLTNSAYGNDETRTISAVNGTAITVTPALSRSSTLPSGATLHLGNLTRNVKVETVDANAGNRALQGHFMAMHTGGHSIRFVHFEDLGRTMATMPVTDPLMVNGVRDASLFPGCWNNQTENVRGRYAVHFHMAGPTSVQSLVEGSVVTLVRNSGFKIGFINHSSNVKFLNNVGLNVDGSTFFTEEGDETGEFTGNLAIYSKGSSSPDDALPDIECMEQFYADIFNRRRGDVGHRGHGFWLHGGETEVYNNVSVGAASTNFELFTRVLSFGLNNTYHVLVPVSVLRDGGAWAAPHTQIDTDYVPAILENNVAYVTSADQDARQANLSIHYHGLHQWEDFAGAPKNLVKNFFGWGARNGIVTTYHGWTRFENVTLIGPPPAPRFTSRAVSLASQGGNSDQLVNVTMDGFTECGSAPVHSTTYENVTCNGVSWP